MRKTVLLAGQNVRAKKGTEMPLALYQEGVFQAADDPPAGMASEMATSASRAPECLGRG